MKRRLRRMGWSLRRLRLSRLVVGIVVVAAAAAGLGLFTDLDLATIGRGAVLLALGLLLASPVAALWSRLMLRRPPWRSTPALCFAGSDLGFRVAGRSGRRREPAIQAAVAAEIPPTAHPTAVEVWLVACDEAGRDQTLIRGRPHRSAWSSSVEGLIEPADRNDPFQAAMRLIAEQYEVPITRVDVLAWGTETLREGSRNAVVAIARTSISAEELLRRTGEESEGRTAHPVALAPTPIADALAWGDPRSWRGAAAYGLLELLERTEPGSWTALEGRVRDRWRDKAMFARVERGTAQIAGRVLAADG